MSRRSAPSTVESTAKVGSLSVTGGDASAMTGLLMEPHCMDFSTRFQCAIIPATVQNATDHEKPAPELCLYTGLLQLDDGNSGMSTKNGSNPAFWTHPGEDGLRSPSPHQTGAGEPLEPGLCEEFLNSWDGTVWRQSAHAVNEEILHDFF